MGSFKPNAFGLYDMAGNVSQWVEDCAHRKYSASPEDGDNWEPPEDGTAWLWGGDCDNRIMRGGSWNDGPQWLRSAARSGGNTEVRNEALGFRVGRTLTP